MSEQATLFTMSEELAPQVGYGPGTMHLRDHFRSLPAGQNEVTVTGVEITQGHETAYYINSSAGKSIRVPAKFVGSWTPAGLLADLLQTGEKQ